MRALTALALMVVVASIEAAPLLETRLESNVHTGGFTTMAGVPAKNRTIFVLISLICVSVLSFLLGSRFGTLKHSILIKRNFISLLVLVIYSLVLIFIVAATVLVAAQGLKTYRLCLAGTWVCLILYTFTKGAIFLFLVERIHIVRSPFVQRKNDKIYLGCLAMVLLMFGPVVVNCYIQPVTYMGAPDGRCHFGIEGRASIPILAVNIFVDLVLTGVFFSLLRPAARTPILCTPSEASGNWSNRNSAKTQAADIDDKPVQNTVRTLLWKSIIGSLLIELPMMANMIQFVVTGGQEFGTICTAVCVVEVAWNVLVIHWLAFGNSAAPEKDSEPASLRSCQAQLTQPKSRLSKQILEDVLVKSHAGLSIKEPEVARLKPQELLRNTHASTFVVSTRY